MTESFYTLRYRPGTLSLIDQTRLPREEVYTDFTEVEEVARAIETMVVRGAPAIGLTAAFGMAVAAHRGADLDAADKRLRATRPTAVNLFWALDRMQEARQKDPSPEHLDAAAQKLYDDDVESCRRIGEIGAALIPDGARILTHCNAGALATSEHGTALSVIRAAHRAGKRIKVYADETRPILQGARLTAWELMRDGIDVTLVPDSAVAHLVFEGAIDCAVTGADRVAANGDAANKIGTRGLACILHHHGLPVYIAAPWSTVDMQLASAAEIPIEERAKEEVTHIGGVQIAPEGVAVRNPAFDVTPAEWISGIITELGVAGPNIAEGLHNQSARAGRA